MSPSRPLMPASISWWSRSRNSSARLEAAKTQKAETIAQLENAKIEVQKPFAYEDELKEKSDKLISLNIELDLDKKDTSAMDTEPKQSDDAPEKKYTNRER